ncbi:MAG: glycosyltransferase [Methylovulum sp.]|nr:glycosyltransferase [Methylovulum sp.]
MIDIVSATRFSEQDFWEKSPLGISLLRLGHDARLTAHIAYENRRGLPEVYNACISAENGNGMVVFIHDDVWIDDDFLADRVCEGLQEFDVIGVAGNRRRVLNQPAWCYVESVFGTDGRKDRSSLIRALAGCFVYTSFKCDESINLSGSVAHGKNALGKITFFGSNPAECELLDGVFIAAKKSALTTNSVFFDPRFDFHFYDLDFCRRARQCGLRLGTWPIGLTHQSGGAFGSKQWQEKYRAYIEKWKG